MSEKGQKEYYLIGSLRNSLIPQISRELRQAGFKIFDSWYAAGPIADDSWKEYEQGRGLTYTEALDDYAAKHVFEFDKYHLDRCDGAILAYPSGKSAHLELGYMLGKGKPGYILLENSEDRWDVMVLFANSVCGTIEELIIKLKEDNEETMLTM